MSKLNFFREYLKKPILSNKAYDCSEIADDFYDEFREGKILKIYTKDKVGPSITIPENGKNEVYVNHFVYSDGEYVYDPRYKNAPVKEKEYLKSLQDLNTVKLIVEEDM